VLISKRMLSFTGGSWRQHIRREFK